MRDGTSIQTKLSQIEIQLNLFTCHETLITYVVYYLIKDYKNCKNVQLLVVKRIITNSESMLVYHEIYYIFIIIENNLIIIICPYLFNK